MSNDLLLALLSRSIHRQTVLLPQMLTRHDRAAQTMPFARPHFEDWMATLNFVLEKVDPDRCGCVGAV